MAAPDTAQERAAALAALTLGIDQGEGGDAAPALERTGREVYAGGDEPRLLVKRASTLGYPTAAGYQRAEAIPGDVVLLTKAQARRLDELGATVAVDADLDEVTDQQAGDLFTDEQIAAGTAAELVAYVAQHPAERERVRTIEEQRDNPRVTVLAATEPTPLEDDEADREALARSEDTPAGEAEDGSTDEDRGEA